MPVAGVKALLYGLAIIASDIEGVKEIVFDNVNGRLCAVNNTAAFIDALITVLTDTDRLRMMKEKSSELALKFDLTKVSLQYEDTFKRVIR
jgi:glycosyltransferase involved in cell wall biosynthesis